MAKVGFKSDADCWRIDIF